MKRGFQPSSRFAVLVSMIAGWLAASAHPATGGANGGIGRAATARGGPADQSYRDWHGCEPELTSEVAHAEDPVPCNVVGARRPLAAHAERDRLPDIFFVDQLERHARSEDGNGYRALLQEREETSAKRLERAGDDRLGKRLLKGTRVANVTLPIFHLRPALGGRVERAASNADDSPDPLVSLKVRHEAEPERPGRPRDRDVQPGGRSDHARQRLDVG